MLDALQRPLRDLRISVTDRCNFRCTYCMPREKFGAGHPFLPRRELLTFEEITRLARIFARLGVEKIRVTGGEPLLRRDLERLITMLAGVDGITDLAMTTNGSLLAEKAGILRAAGLGRLTVSLDSLDETVFAAMNGAEFSAGAVIEGIEAAVSAGFVPLKINMVVQRGVNETSILPMVRRFQSSEFVLRLIEYMDVGNTNAWQRYQVVTNESITDEISRLMPLIPLPANYPGEVARRFRHAKGGGEIGLISSVSQPFCGSCSRARISADGRLYTCLFASEGFDLRALLRAGCTDDEIRARIAQIWAARSDRYSEMRATWTKAVPKVEMSHIGG